MATTATSGFLGLSRRTWIFILIAVLIGTFAAWKVLSRERMPEGFAAGNGRLEANEIYVSAKFPGRIKEVLVNEGDTVTAGQVVARMDTEELEARLRQALAQMREAQDSERVARADVGTKRAQIGT